LSHSLTQAKVSSYGFGRPTLKVGALVS